MRRHPIETRIVEIEEALAHALNRGDFEVVTDEGHRYLEPVLGEHVIGGNQCVLSIPRLDLSKVARDIERYLS